MSIFSIIAWTLPINKYFKSNIYKLNHAISFRDLLCCFLKITVFFPFFFIFYCNTMQSIFVVYRECLFILLWHIYPLFPFAVHQSLPVPLFFFQHDTSELVPIATPSSRGEPMKSLEPSPYLSSDNASH